MVKCKFCKEELINRRKGSNFCNKSCYRKYLYYLDRENNIKKSMEYKIKHYTPKIVKKICPQCEKEFIKKNNSQRFCKKECCIKYFDSLGLEHKREIQKRFYRKHKEELKVKRNKFVKMKRKTDMNFKIRHDTRTRINQIVKKAISKELKIQLRKGIRYLAIAQLLINTIPKDYNERVYQIDHIKPLCSFDLTKEEDFKEAFAPENHRWLLAKDNFAKSKQDRLLSIKRKYEQRN
jgi:hypothetical protein